MDLELIRQNIDVIDQELVILIEKRMNLVSQVAAFKKETGKAIYDKEREDAILTKVSELVTDKNYEPFVVATFADIMKESRAYQNHNLEDEQNPL
ncbi:chorismate mutase [Streptococcus dentasini]